MRHLVAAAELDELRLLVVPTVRGAGMRLFRDERADLSLLDSKPLENGVLRLVYEVARP